MAAQAETQGRFFNTKVNIEGYNSYLSDLAGIDAIGILTNLGWSMSGVLGLDYLNARTGDGDTFTGASCMFINDQSITGNPQFAKALTKKNIKDAFTYGFELQALVKTEGASEVNGTDSSCAWIFGIDASDDPRVDTLYLIDRDFDTDPTYLSLHTNVQSINGDGGYLEFTYHGLTDEPSIPGVIFGQGSGFDSYILINEDERLVISVAGVTYSNATWQMIVGQPNLVKIQRQTGTIDVEINGVVGTQATGVAAAGIQIRHMGRADTTQSSRRFGISNMKALRSTGDTQYEWDFPSYVGESVIPDTANTEGKSWSAVRYDDTNWRNVGGVDHRLLMAGGYDSAQQGYAMYDGLGVKDKTIQFADDSRFHTVSAVVGPSPDGVTWGEGKFVVDGTIVGVPLTTWAHQTTATSALSLQSGSTSAIGRESKHIYFQAFIYQDTRLFTLLGQGFEVNAIGGVIGEWDLTIDIPETANTVVGCSTMTIELLGDTKLTRWCADINTKPN
jgi:hypothetical protein